MNAEAVVALVALVVALPFSVLAYFQSRTSNVIAKQAVEAAGASAEVSRQAALAAERAANAAERQTEIQEAVRRASAEPYIWVDLRPDLEYGELVTLVIGNSGATIATNIRVTIDPPLAGIEHLSDAAQYGATQLASGLASLPPGRTISWSMGMGWTVISAEALNNYRITIDADGPFGPIDTVTYQIDLDAIKESRAVPPGTLYGIARKLSELNKILSKKS